MNTALSTEPSPVRTNPASRACRVHRFGGPEVIVLEEVEPPAPAEGEVLVRVKAAGVGPWDAWIRAGNSALPQPLPLTLGSDISGVVVAAGPGVTAFVPGDDVFGVTNPRFTGGYADHAIAVAGMLAPKPATLPHIDAASVPVVAVTAWQALFEQAQLKAGQSVLVLGAAGSVGGYAVQLARRAGLHVLATADTRHFDHVRGLGADAVFDARGEHIEAVGSDLDAVIDLVGGETQARAFAVLKPGGVLISAVSPPDQAVAGKHGVRAAFFLVDVTAERLARLAALIEAGALATSVGAILPLVAARIAHEMLEGRRPRPRGKIVLRVAD